MDHVLNSIGIHHISDFLSNYINEHLNGRLLAFSGHKRLITSIAQGLSATFISTVLHSVWRQPYWKRTRAALHHVKYAQMLHLYFFLF